jgi:hypothetical protein
MTKAKPKPPAEEPMEDTQEFDMGWPPEEDRPWTQPEKNEP